MPERPFTYAAFMSYSHAADDRLAPALQSALHQFGKPWNKLRALKVFRDKTSLAMTPALWPAIEKALSSSESFLLLACPEAARSQWVNDEITWWLTERGPDTLYLLLTDGEILWDDARGDFDWRATTGLPACLEGKFKTVPKYVDLKFARTAEKLTLREPTFRAAVLDIAAPLHHKPKEELDGEDVRQYRRTQRIKRVAVSLLVALTILSAALAVAAEWQRRSAVRTTSRLLQEQGRQELVQGNADRALAYLGEAVELGGSGPVLRFLVTHAARAVELERGVFDLRAGPVVALAVAPGGAFAAATAHAVHLHGPAGDRVLEAKEPTSVAFSRDGARVIAVVRGGATVWDARSGAVIATVAAAGAVHAELSPRADRVVVTTGDVAQIWPLPAKGTGPLAVLRHEGDVNDARFSPDGAEVVTASWDRTGAVWKASDGERLSLLPGHDGDVTCSAWSNGGASGPLVVTCGADDTARIWDPTTGELRRTLDGHRDTVTLARFSADGTRVLTASRDGTARVWDVGGGGEPTVLDAGAGPVDWAELDASGRTVLTRHADRTVRVWNAVGGDELETLSTDALAARFCDGDACVVTGGADGRVRVWDLEKARWRRSLVGHTHDVVSFAFSPDGAELATGSADHTARLWRNDDDPRSRVLRGHRAPVVAVAFDADGQRVATGDATGVVRLWRAADGASEGDAPPANGGIRRIAFLPSGARLVTLGTDGAVSVWTVAPLAVVRTLGSVPGSAEAVLAPGGASILVWSPSAVRTWDLESGAPGFALDAPESDVVGADFGRGGAIVVAMRGGEIRLFTPPGTAPVAVLKDEEPLSGLSSSPTRALLAVSREGVTHVWDMESGVVVGVVEGIGVAFSADGELLVSRKEGAALLWSARPVRVLARWAGRPTLKVAAFDPAGETLLTVGGAEAPRLWAMWPGRGTARDTLDSVKGKGAWRIVDGALVPAPRSTPARR